MTNTTNNHFVIASKPNEGKTTTAISFAINKLQETGSQDLELIIVNPDVTVDSLKSIVKSACDDETILTLRVIESTSKNNSDAIATVEKLIQTLKTEDKRFAVILENTQVNSEVIPVIEDVLLQIETTTIPVDKDIQEFINDITHGDRCVQCGICERTEDGIDLTFY